METESKEKKFQNCWEFIECPIEIRKNCEAYKRNLGDICWFVANDAGTECFGYKQYKGCKNCPWYKHHNH